MRIFRSKAFIRFARKSSLSDAALCKAARNMERGLIDADLGGGIVKQRIPRPGKGKSSGFRVIVLYRAGTLAFFVHGFAKSDRENLRDDEVVALKALASLMLAYDNKTIAKAVRSGAIVEVICDEETQIVS
jgi:hypothetical protein